MKITVAEICRLHSIKQFFTSLIILGAAFTAGGCKDTPQPPAPPTQIDEPTPAVQTETEIPKETPAPAKEGREAFFEAAFTGNMAFVESEIIAGVSADALNADKQTALMLAAFNGHTNIVELLITHGSNVNITDGMNRTALMMASSGPFSETVKLLLAKGADVNITDSHEGWTALMFAAAEGQAENVLLLMAAGADTTAKDTDGDTAETFAAKAGHAAVAKMIRDHALTRQNK